MQIAIFGGSFDPVHMAHVTIVNKALESLEIDKIIVVPTYLNPFKNHFYLDPNLRFSLLKKVFDNNEKIEVCNYEIKQMKPVYSIETVKYLKNLYNASKIYIIIGQDNVIDLNKWHKIDELKEIAEFVIATRIGYKHRELNGFKILEVDINISSTKLREKLDLNFIPEQIKEDIINL